MESQFLCAEAVQCPGPTAATRLGTAKRFQGEMGEGNLLAA